MAVLPHHAVAEGTDGRLDRAYLIAILALTDLVKSVAGTKVVLLWSLAFVEDVDSFAVSRLLRLGSCLSRKLGVAYPLIVAD